MANIYKALKPGGLLFIGDVGFGMFQSPNNSAIMGSVPKERLGIASGLLLLSRTFGQMSGLPLMGALFAGLTLSSAHLAQNADVTAAPPEALVYGFQGTFRRHCSFVWLLH